MTATRNDIELWLHQAREQGSGFLIVGHDWWDHENFPIYCKDAAEVHDALDRLRCGGNRYDEVYDMSLSVEEQMQEHRAIHIPPDPRDSK